MRAPVLHHGVAVAVAAASLVSLASLASLAPGCLPGDARPVPESVYVTAEPSEAVARGFDSADGWRITFDRLLLGVGNVVLTSFSSNDPFQSSPCNYYADAYYDRLFDFTVAGREKVGTVYGLGICGVSFELREPSFRALLGPGVTASDAAAMRTRGSDRYAEDKHVSVVAVGSASRAGETKRFEWRFRRSYIITNCAIEGGGYATNVELTEAAASEMRLEVRGEELFRALPDDGAEFQFQPMADADADGDGLVTLDELSMAPGPTVGSGQIGSGGGSPGEGGGAPEEGMPLTMEALVYELLLPRLLRVRGAGVCETWNVVWG